MKLTDSLIPYNLMSMHPLLHASMLITGLILSHSDKTNFYSIDDSCTPTSKDGLDFVNEGKFYLMQRAFLAHALAIVLHFGY